MAAIISHYCHHHFSVPKEEHKGLIFFLEILAMILPENGWDIIKWITQPNEQGQRTWWKVKEIEGTGRPKQTPQSDRICESGAFHLMLVRVFVSFCSFLFGREILPLVTEPRDLGFCAGVVINDLVTFPALALFLPEHWDVTLGVMELQGHSIWGHALPLASHQSPSIATCVFPMTPCLPYFRVTCTLPIVLPHSRPKVWEKSIQPFHLFIIGDQSVVALFKLQRTKWAMIAQDSAEKMKWDRVG